MPIDNPLQVVASAVTPVVLVSATAILISGVNSRHIAIADRIRSLTAEYRSDATNPTRRAGINRQLPAFKSRIRLASWAIRGLYLASACFVTMALLISATLWREILAVATVPLFIAGILLLLVSIVCELWELQKANRTLFDEISDLDGTATGTDPHS
jgi:hypothetical protein